MAIASPVQRALLTGRGRDLISDYIALTKPRILSLLLVTGGCGYLAGAERHPHVWPLLAVLGGGALAAGGANSLNCAFDRDLDAAMRRTRRRPVPAGRVPPSHAVAFGLLLNALAAAWLTLGANALSAELALAGSVWYVLVYTSWLKRRSPLNIVIGGAAGCFPPLVGWAAATGSLAPAPLLLAAVVFLWTPPHFWALAVVLREDYRAAGVPMLPVVVTLDETAARIMLYTVATVGASLIPAFLGLGLLYGVVAVGAGAGLIRRALRFRRRPSPGQARQLFKYSLVYLAALFSSAAVGPRLPF